MKSYRRPSHVHAHARARTHERHRRSRIDRYVNARRVISVIESAKCRVASRRTFETRQSKRSSLGATKNPIPFAAVELPRAALEKSGGESLFTKRASELYGGNTISSRRSRLKRISNGGRTSSVSYGPVKGVRLYVVSAALFRKR